MKKSLDLERLLGEIPKQIIWGRKAPEEETQLAQFFRWIAWVSEQSTAELSVAMGLHNSAFFWNMRIRAGGAAPGFLIKAYTYLEEELFPGCPIDIRQLKLLGELTGDQPDRWQALVKQIQEFCTERAKT